MLSSPFWSAAGGMCQLFVANLREKEDPLGYFQRDSAGLCSEFQQQKWSV